MFRQIIIVIFGLATLICLVSALKPAQASNMTVNFIFTGILGAITLVFWSNLPSRKKVPADESAVIEFSAKPSDAKLLKTQLKLGLLGLAFDYDKFLNVLDQDEMLGVADTGIYNTKQTVIVVTSKRLLLCPQLKQDAWFAHAVPVEDILATSLIKDSFAVSSLRVDAEGVSVLVEKIAKERAEKLKAIIDKNITKPAEEMVTNLTSKVSSSTVSPSAAAPIANNQPTVKCPKCGAFSLAANKQGYGWKKGVAGGLLTGGVGLLVGFAGSSKVWVTCVNCGNKWQAGKNK